MYVPAFLFEVTDKMPSIAYMYASGLILALLVFAATYFHRQVGLIILIFVGFLCVRDVETPDIVNAAIKEAGQNHINHWYFSSRITFVLSVILFFTAIILKREIKRRRELK